jgi:hypothetical protein
MSVSSCKYMVLSRPCIIDRKSTIVNACWSTNNLSLSYETMSGAFCFWVNDFVSARRRSIRFIGLMSLWKPASCMKRSALTLTRLCTDRPAGEPSGKAASAA